MIVWPMGLPPTDPVRLELENCEELQGTQESKMVLDPAKTTLWFATKELTREKKLKDFLGKNEKTKVCPLCIGVIQANLALCRWWSNCPPQGQVLR